MRDFEGKTAVVTGGASGIGFALAERFAAAHMQVVLADIEKSALEHAVKKLQGRQARVIGIPVNTMLRESVQDLFEQAVAEFGNIHVLCNNAGVAATGDGGRAVWESAAEDWDWVMGVNFWGVLYGLQSFVPHMCEHGESGHIVNTASLAGLLPGGGTYGVSKHAVLALSEGLHRDLKSRDAAIGASVLCPGFVATNIFDAERNRPSELQRGAEAPNTEMMEAAKHMLSQGKAPSDVADRVFESIEKERFYILPHPAWDDIVSDRVAHVVARGEPMTIDFMGMLDRRAKGEQF
ncbi:MAG: SDR family NAD(P)-dependent oxidoreductase [Hyphomicrobium sp.]